jgi:hypothetical protein
MLSDLYEDRTTNLALARSASLPAPALKGIKEESSINAEDPLVIGS